MTTHDCVFIYSKHFSVELRKGDTRLTKSGSNNPEDDQQLRKKLRPKIAGERVVQDEQNIKKRAVFPSICLVGSIF